MSQVHFAPMEDEDDDMYSGFNDYSATDMTQVSQTLSTRQVSFRRAYLSHLQHQEWHPVAVADLEGGRAGSGPSFGRRTDAVTVLLISEQ